MKFPLNEESIVKANSQFWEQMLAMKLEMIPLAGEFRMAAQHMFGAVDLNGVWKGRIEVRMTGKLAYEATSAMMMMPVDTVAEAEVLDATKEIANMLAGTIKSSLPRPCSMTVPESAVRADEFHGLAAVEDAILVVFRHHAGELLVRIWEEEFVQH